MSTIFIQYVSDYTCPYCYVERLALLKAIEGFDAEIQWLPYELSPVSKPRVDTFHDPVRKQKYRRTLVPLCKKMDISMKLPPKVVPRPYTNLATQGGYYADMYDKGQEYSAAVLSAYYEKEKDIGDIEVLAEIAQSIGLDPIDFTQALENGRYAKAVQRMEQYVQKSIQPKTFPTILLGDSIRLDGGLHTVEQLKSYLKQAEQQETLTVSGTGCDENGCSF